MDIKEVMQRQFGPMPVWAWTALAASFIAGIVLFRKRSTPKSDTGGNGQAANGSPVGEFNSGQSTTTTDVNGNQITTQYNASGPLTGYPGFLTTQAGPMPYSAGDIYVNVPATNAAPEPPKQQTQTMRQLLDTSKFNAQTAAGVPFTMMVALPGETWKDVAARAWGFADNFSQITDPKVQAQVTHLATVVSQSNNAPGSTGNGPAPGQIVLFH